jgi:Serine hydrolase (FSH1)
MFQKPYFSCFESTSPSKILAALAPIHEIVETEGLFECVMTFSQGTSVAAFLLQHEIDNPAIPPPI